MRRIELEPASLLRQVSELPHEEGVDLLFNVVDDALYAPDFVYVNEILLAAIAAVDELPLHIVTSLLTATMAHKRYVEVCRDWLYAAAVATAVERGANVTRVFGGLEGSLEP